MIHWLRFAVQVGAASYALWRSRAFPLFFFYFCAWLGDTLCGEIVYFTFGDRSQAYFYTYLTGTCFILLFALWLAWDSIPSPYRLRKCALPCVVAVILARITALECPSGLNSRKALVLAAGAILFFCGQVLSTAATYARSNHTAMLILGILWLAQGWYFFAYLIQSPEWKSTGYWFPALLCSAGFVLVGRTLRPIRGG